MARNFYCEVCSVQMSGPASFSQHSLGKKHKRNVLRAEKYVNPRVPPAVRESGIVLPPQTFFCELCRTSCSSPENYEEHCSGRRHLRNVRREKIRRERELEEATTAVSSSNSIYSSASSTFGPPELFAEKMPTPVLADMPRCDSPRSPGGSSDFSDGSRSDSTAPEFSGASRSHYAPSEASGASRSDYTPSEAPQMEPAPKFPPESLSLASSETPSPQPDEGVDPIDIVLRSAAASPTGPASSSIPLKLSPDEDASTSLHPLLFSVNDLLRSYETQLSTLRMELATEKKRSRDLEIDVTNLRGELHDSNRIQEEQEAQLHKNKREIRNLKGEVAMLTLQLTSDRADEVDRARRRVKSRNIRRRF